MDGNENFCNCLLRTQERQIDVQRIKKCKKWFNRLVSVVNQNLG